MVTEDYILNESETNFEEDGGGIMKRTILAFIALGVCDY